MPDEKHAAIRRAIELWGKFRSHPLLSICLGLLAIVAFVDDARTAGQWMLTFFMFLFSRSASLIIIIVILAHIFQDSWLPWSKRLRTAIVRSCRLPPRFQSRPICGNTLLWAGDLDELEKMRVTARLAIRNTSGKLRRRCSVRLENAWLLFHGYIMGSANTWPSICGARGEGFLLRWSDKEDASADRKYLDIQPDNAEHIVEVLVLDVHERMARFAAANPDDLEKNLQGVKNGWFQLHIKIASEDGTHHDSLWVAACSDRDPGPITLDYWEPRGPKILEEQKAEG